ncbi:MAG: glucose 1-dehydrogenase [Nitrosopumilales archaeon]|jgi:NAD(P)-dependent dehydrogenase (short-subunit alcohol dehydrogenase family)|nr:glucose 1-dehydrogenase [Nitrosopumilales archaeon]MRN61455.1 glucose 1-dehydrogenase [Nitrosopumilales archaeon]MRN68861.1 glucose 1-dehydrogenase [Nitrosopumilales archaeon]
MSLKGKVAIVSGAGTGVGKATTKRLFSEGAKVVLIGRDRSRLTKVISDLNGKKNLLAVKADITKEADVINVIEETVSAFDTVDILVNNAGILNDPTPFHKMTDEQWMSLINTNLIGTFRTTKAVLPIMMEKRRGSIVNISSLQGIRSILNVPFSVYGVTKAGVIMFTRTIAVEYGEYGIRCNCVAPSTIRSPMIEPYLQDKQAKKTLESSFPLRRIGDPEDISGAVSYLCSDDAKWITGTVLTVDGGMSAKQ